MTNTVVELAHAKKAFGDNEVLKDISLTVNKGDVLAVIGPSGGGKSTLLRCMTLLETLDAGSLAYGDLVVCSEGAGGRAVYGDAATIARAKTRYGLVFQNFNLFPHYTVLQNVTDALICVQKMPRDEALARGRELLARMGLAGKESMVPCDLSGGQQQRVAIARALVSNSSIIVLDEPITNLDAKLREQMLEEIREIQRKSGTTVLYITHDQQSALQLCDRMAIMEPDGSLCQLGTDEDIILHPANRFTFEFIGVSNFIPVEVAGSAITLRPGQKDFPWADGKLPEGTDTSKKLELGVRPNDIVFDKDSSLRVTVKRSVFLGSEYDYFVELGGRELRIQQNTLDAAKYGVMREGQETGIRLLNYRFYPEKEVSA